MRRRAGLSLVELLISLTIVTAVMVGVFGGFRYLAVTQKSNIANTIALQRAEKAFANISKDIAFALGIDTGTYVATNTATSFTITLPSIKSNGTIITEDVNGDPVTFGTYKDYVYYWYESSDKAIKRQVIIDASAPAPVGRANSTATIAKNIDSVAFSSAGTTGSTLNLLNDTQLGNMDTLYISLTSTYNRPNADPINKTLSFKVRFRNK